MGNSVSPLLFQSYAKRNPSTWAWLIGQPLHHTKFGFGKTKRLENQRDPIFWVEFDEILDGKSERCFVGSALNGILFDEIWLPEDQINVILADEQRRIKNEQSAKTAIKKQPISTTSTVLANSAVQTKVHRPTSKSQPANQTGSVKCPYCAFSYSPDTLSSHISRAHPTESKKKAMARSKPAKPKAAKDAVVVKASVTPAFLKCPYCSSPVKERNYVKHIRKVHPNQPVPEKREAAQPPKAYRRQRAPITLQTPKQRVYRIRKSSGGVIQQTSVRTLNVGKRRGAVIRRRSY